MKAKGARIGIVATSVAAVLLLAGCDDEEARRGSHRESSRRERGEEQRSEGSYRVLEFEDGGSIAGQIRWSGPRPEPVQLPVRQHREHCGASQPSRALQISERGGVADAVVWLVDVEAGRALERPEEPVTIDRADCRFQPHVTAVPVGSRVRFANSDSILHNVHGTRSDRTVFDLGLPRAGSAQLRVIEAPGVIRLVCDAGHGWERAWIHAFEHPYFAVADAEGRFRIADVPPGRYLLRVWHAGWRIAGTRAGRPRYSRPVVLGRQVSVSQRQETTLDFELSQESGELAGE